MRKSTISGKVGKFSWRAVGTALAKDLGLVARDIMHDGGLELKPRFTRNVGFSDYRTSNKAGIRRGGYHFRKLSFGPTGCLG